MEKESRFEQLYNCLLEQGEVRGLKNMTGIWEQDKKKFIKLQTELENLANYIEVDEEQ